MELLLESLLLSFFVLVHSEKKRRRGEKLNHVALFTLVRGGNKKTSPTPKLHLPKINPSPQGSGLHRWVCSDTLVRLKSQAGFINSYPGSVDTPFCVVTNGCINLLCPSVLQNYISSYMIESDWLQSGSPLNLSEPAEGLGRGSSAVTWMPLEWWGVFLKHTSRWCQRRRRRQARRRMATVRKEKKNPEKKLRAMRDKMCLWHDCPLPLLPTPPPWVFLSLCLGAGTFIWFPGWVPRRPHRSMLLWVY